MTRSAYNAKMLKAHDPEYRAAERYLHGKASHYELEQAFEKCEKQRLRLMNKLDRRV